MSYILPYIGTNNSCTLAAAAAGASAAGRVWRWGARKAVAAREPRTAAAGTLAASVWGLQLLVYGALSYYILALIEASCRKLSQLASHAQQLQALQ